MNKKILAVVIALILVVSCAFALVACGKYPDVKGKTYTRYSHSATSEGIVWDDTNRLEFNANGKDCILRSPDKVQHGTYVQNGNTVKILWMNSPMPIEIKMTESLDLIFNDQNYAIKESK